MIAGGGRRRHVRRRGELKDGERKGLCRCRVKVLGAREIREDVVGGGVEALGHAAAAAMRGCNAVKVFKMKLDIALEKGY